MHVWMLKAGEPLPSDAGARLMRFGQLTKAMVARGHQVTWWTGSVEHLSKSFRTSGEWQASEGFTVINLPAVAYRKNISIRRYLNYRQVAAGFARMAPRRAPPDLVLAAIPCHHFALAGVRYAKRAGCVSVIDHRDLWPEIFAAALPRIVPRLFLAREFAVQRQAFQLADAVLGISPGYVELGVARAGRAATRWDRHFYLGAFARQGAARPLPPPLARWAGRKLFIYTGTFARSYELRLVLRAARDLAAERDDFAVVLCGQGAEDFQAELDGHPAALALGWMGREELAGLLPHGYAGLMPFRAGALQSIPNKAFDYFSAGLPVINSLAGEMEQLVRGREVGLQYPCGDGRALREAMAHLLDDEERRDTLARNARLFFREEGDSGHIYDRYCRHLEGVVAAKTPG